MKHDYRSVAPLLIAIVLVIALSSAVSANLLTNGSFESGPYGTPFVKLDPGVTPDPGVWYSEGYNNANLFEGIFDSTWHNPPPADHPEWPTPFPPLDGSYYLGRYVINQPWASPLGGLMGAAYQMVPVSPDTTYYLSAWHVGFHPQGGGAGVRIGIDPTGAVGASGQPDWGSPDIIWEPATSLGGSGEIINNFDYSNVWKKIQTSATTGPDATMATVWVEYTATSNNVSLPQFVQVDAVNLSTQQSSLLIQDVEVVGVNYTSTTAVYKLTFRVTDGTTDVQGAAATLTLNSAPVSAPTRGTDMVWTKNLTGLTLNSANTFTISATCPGYDDATYTGTFNAYPVLKLAADPVESNLSQSGVTISWTTLDVSTSQPVATTGIVQYGDNYSFSATDTAGLTADHSVTLTGLVPNQIYNYRVVSDRPEGSTNPGPYGLLIKNKDSNGALLSFQTLGGAFFNGDFEQAYSLPIHTGDPIPGWTKFNNINLPGDPSWFASGEWSIPSQHGARYILYPSNYGNNPQGGIYQNFSTTPGEFVVFSAWAWSEAWCEGGLPTGGGPHRFGETSVKIGLDPTGGIDPTSPNIIWSADRETLDWAVYTATAGAHNSGWQKMQIGAYAAGESATIFLKWDALWNDPWILAGFDNVTQETGPASVTSVAEAKQLPNDSVISLSGNVVVTAVYNYDTPSYENFGKPYFYIQDEDGTAGIKVVMADGSDIPGDITVGKRVSVDGMITWGHFYEPTPPKSGYYDQQQRLNKPAGERVIRALPGKITVGTDGNLPKVVGMSNRDLCGGSSSDHWFTNPGVDGGVGPNNVGKLVRIWGKVFDAGQVSAGPYVGRFYLAIDDGSGVPRYGSKPGAETYGVFIDIGTDYMNFMNLSAHIGDYAVVTGVSAPALDFDWDDPPADPNPEPEAMKNVRTIKPLSFDAPNMVFMPAQ